MLKHLLVLIIISLLLINCGDKNNDPVKNLSDTEKYSYDSTDLKTEGIDESGKPFMMEYKFKKGDKISYRLTTISNNTQSITIDSTISSGVDQKIIYLFIAFINCYQIEVYIFIHTVVIISRFYSDEIILWIHIKACRACHGSSCQIENTHISRSN